MLATQAPRLGATLGSGGHRTGEALGGDGTLSEQHVLPRDFPGFGVRSVSFEEVWRQALVSQASSDGWTNGSPLSGVPGRTCTRVGRGVG